MSFKHKIFDWYPIQTPVGGDYITCPRCKKWIKNEYDYSNKCTIRNGYKICCKCSLVFNRGCTLCENGCSDGISYPIVYMNKNDIFEFKRSKKYTTEQTNKFYRLIKDYKKYCFCIDYWCNMKESYVNSNITKDIYVCYPKNEYPEYYKCDCVEEVLSDIYKEILPIDIIRMLVKYIQ